MIETGQGFVVDFTALTLGAFTVGMLMEMLLPAREGLVSAWRWLNNTTLALVTYVCNHLIGTFTGLLVIANLEARPFTGLAGFPLWLDAGLAFLTLELTRYGAHVALHKIDLLWRFHAVHHADNAVDVSTAFRHHPIEAVLGAVPITAIVWLMASSPEALIIYRAWDLIMTVMTHTNIKVPPRLERWLRYIVVTPTYHRTHHMAEKRFTDSNYGNSVPWFDYIFSTYQHTTAAQQRFAKMGLDSHTVNEQRIDGMLWAPFSKRSTQSI